MIDPCVVGMTAPEFLLDAMTPDLQPTRLGRADYQGKWVMLIFYPRDFSFVCPTELTGFSAEKEKFDQLECELLGISIDTVESHGRWLSTPEDEGGVSGLRFPLASDPNGEICKRFGVWRESSELPNRGLFLIDPEWTLRYSVTHDLSVGRNVDDVLRTLSALKTGGLCPSNWKRADGVLDVSSMLKPGRVLGNYRMNSKLGQGGFGQVWRAEDLRLKRNVALKIIAAQSPEAESGAGQGSNSESKAEESLLQEARLAAGINHPHVCTVYAADSIDTLPVIAMEYVEGGTLADAIEKGIRPNEFRKLAREIANGLAAAHEQQIVHGDLKPANILLDSTGRPVIADFGLAKAMSQSKERRSDRDQEKAESSRVSPAADPLQSVELEATMVWDLNTRSFEGFDSAEGQQRFITGTPAYMSPEQASGEPLDQSSDVFSLGLILGQMLTGQSLFGDLAPMEIVKALRQVEFVDALPDRLPESGRSELTDLLASDPDKRPAAEVVSERFGTLPDVMGDPV